MRQAIDARHRTGQAQGILIDWHKLSPDTAFAYLTRMSQDTNTKSRVLAERLITTGRLTPPDEITET